MFIYVRGAPSRPPVLGGFLCFMGGINSFFLFGVMFITLLERKILRRSQLRVGPRKVGIDGIVQPILDGVKLILKRFFIIARRKKILFFVFSNHIFLVRVILLGGAERFFIKGVGALFFLWFFLSFWQVSL